MASPLPGRAVTFRARGVSDAIDGTNAFPGAMALLQNLISDPKNRYIYVPRPGVTGLIGSGGNPSLWGSFTWGAAPWGGFDSISGASDISAELVIGNICYGMIASTSGVYAGLDVPFAFNIATGAFETINIPRGASVLPTTQPTTGDWTPPVMRQVGSRILITHPGFSGGLSPFFGWLDLSGFSDTTHTGDTHSSTTINNLSANVLQAGWQVGMTITGAGIPANTTIAAIAAGGLSVTLSQAATATAVGVALTVAGGTSTAPLYDAGNTNLNALAQVPITVGQFNGRAYFGLPNGSIPYSDALNACQMTTATQVLQPANGLPVTAFGGLPYQQTTGGILQALIGFQGDSGMQQITGDPVTNNLALNNIGIGTGTLAPNTVCQTDQGLAFIAEDGLRIMGFLGQISDPIGADGDGICVPFLNAVFPSRMCAAYNQNVLRVSVQNGDVAGSPWQEYWYHFKLKTWSGPHTFPAALIQPYQGLSNHGFVMVGQGIAASLFLSDCIPSLSTVYLDNGNAIVCAWKTALLPDNGEMSENSVVESTLALTLPSGAVASVTAANESGVQLDSIAVNGPAQSPSTWGSLIWGAGSWSAPQNFLRQYDVPWTQELVFKQMTVEVTTVAAANLAIGNLYFRHEALPFRLQAMDGVAVSGGAI